MLRRTPRLNIAGDVGSGPPVVLVHGIASSSVTFVNLVPLIQGRHRVISIDILGFGRSPVPPDAEYTLEEHVASLHATVRGLRLREPAVLVGHSLGSLIASRYAATHRRGVSRLVLVGPPIYVSPPEIGDSRVRSRVAAYLRLYEFLRANKKFTIPGAAMLAKLMPAEGLLEVTERNWVPFVKSLEHCIEQQTVVTDIASLRVPVDVVYGSLDAFIAPGALTVIERMEHVRMHRVAINDHLIRPRLAKVLAQAIDSPTSEGNSE